MRICDAQRKGNNSKEKKLMEMLKFIWSSNLNDLIILSGDSLICTENSDFPILVQMSGYEMQVPVNSYQNPTFADGTCGSIYGQHP